MLASNQHDNGLSIFARPWNSGLSTWANVAATSGTDTADTNGTIYFANIFIPGNLRITGIQYLVGSVGGTDKVIASLHDHNGGLLANSAIAGTTVGTTAQLMQVPLTSIFVAPGPGYFFLGLTFNGTTAKFRSIPAYTNFNGVFAGSAVQTFGTPATFALPTTQFTADVGPVAGVY